MSVGGPGWIKDIFDCKLVFDDSSYTLVPDEYLKLEKGRDEKIKAFDGKGAISGKLVIVPPEGRDVTHRGVEITLTSASFIRDNTDGSYFPVVNKTWLLLEAGSVNEPIECPFDIDLAELTIRDTFTGEHMSFRHTISFRVVRPWYTFSVRGEEALVIRNCVFASPAVPEKTVLVVDDFGAECSFDHGKCTFSADGQLVGTVSFRGMSASSAVSEVAVLLGRSEKWSLDMNGVENQVRVHTLHSSEQAPIDTDVTLAIDVSLPAMGGTAGVALPPTMPRLTPSDPGTDSKSVVEVEYWLRLLITKADAKQPTYHWDTHPIILEPCQDSFGL